MREAIIMRRWEVFGGLGGTHGRRLGCAEGGHVSKPYSGVEANGPVGERLASGRVDWSCLPNWDVTALML